MRILKDETIAIIVDVQERLFPVVYNNSELAEKIVTLIQGLKALEVPIILTEQYKKGLGETIEPIKALLPEAVYTEKIAFSCCDEPNFVAEIEKHSSKYVLLVGIEAHICLLQTAIDLKSKGYQPVVIEDCVASRDPENKRVAITRLIQEGVLISSMESILFELCRRAGSDTFKTISKLIK